MAAPLRKSASPPLATHSNTAKQYLRLLIELLEDPSRDFAAKRPYLGERVGRGSYGEVFKPPIDFIVKAMIPDSRKSLSTVYAKALSEHNWQKRAHRSCPAYTTDSVGVYTDGKRVYAIQGYARGETLVRIHGDPLINDRVKAKVMETLTRAVACLHSHHIYHGDLKEDNILFDLKSGTLKIIDFGLAHAASNTLKVVQTNGRARAYDAENTRLFFDSTGQNAVYSGGRQLREGWGLVTPNGRSTPLRNKLRKLYLKTLYMQSVGSARRAQEAPRAVAL